MIASFIIKKRMLATKAYYQLICKQKLGHARVCGLAMFIECIYLIYNVV